MPIYRENVPKQTFLRHRARHDTRKENNCFVVNFYILRMEKLNDNEQYDEVDPLAAKRKHIRTVNMHFLWVQIFAIDFHAL